MLPVLTIPTYQQPGCSVHHYSTTLPVALGNYPLALPGIKRSKKHPIPPRQVAKSDA